jgi:hypothetical protein
MYIQDLILSLGNLLHLNRRSCYMQTLVSQLISSVHSELCAIKQLTQNLHHQNAHPPVRRTNTQRFNTSATLLYKAHRDITPALNLVHFGNDIYAEKISAFSAKVLSYVCYFDITTVHTR